MTDSLIPIPESLLVRFDGWKRDVAWSYNPEMTTYRLTSPSGGVQYLKVGTPNGWPPLEHERVRMEWAFDFLPVPVVVDHHHDHAVQWLITVGLPGVAAVDHGLLARPGDVVVWLAEALRVFHDVPVASCPFDRRLDCALALAQDRVERGVVDAARDFHDEYKHLTPAQALSRLQMERPTSEDLVVCHGDYCPPNVLFDGGRLSGFVDLSELGVADRWWDLAVATWSVGWNLGEQCQPMFLEAYGIGLDDHRCAYYRLLYDMVS